jgi:hypothetical protein
MGDSCLFANSEDYWLVRHDWDKEEELVFDILAPLGKPIATQLAKQWRQESCLQALHDQILRWQLSNGMAELRYGDIDSVFLSPE